MKALLRRISLFVILIGFMAAAAVMLLLDPDPDAGTIFLVITSFALVSALMGTWLVLPPIVDFMQSKMKTPGTEEDLFP